MRAGGRILMIFGVVLGIIAAVATFVILQNTAQTPGAEGAAPVIESEQVIVAFQTIEPWQEIPADAIGLREYPLPLPTDAILASMPASSVESAEGAEPVVGENGLVSGMDYVAGKISNTRIYPGQVIVSTQLVDKELEEQRLGLGGDLSYIIPDGMVAMAIPLDQVSSVAGAVKAGDQVDIIATVNLVDEANPEGEPESVTQFLLQRVEIVRVGPWSVNAEEEQQQAGGVVTVIVEPQQALELKRLREGANWEFVLRSITDESDFVTEPVDDDYMIEQYNIAP